MTRIPEKTAWIRLRKPQPQARLRLFCFPFAGGGALTYRTWQEHLSPHIEVCPVQLPGRENRIREQPFRRMQPLVEAICTALAPYLDLPYAFFGHSLGAIVGYEVCQSLEQRHIRPELLLVSARRPPELPVERVLHDRPRHELFARLQELGGTPARVLQDPDWMEILEPMLRADFELHETYRPRLTPRLDCPLVAFGGSADPEVNRSQLEGWRRVTTGHFGLQMFAGGHFYLNDCRDLLTAVKQELWQVIGGRHPVATAPAFAALHQRRGV